MHPADVSDGNLRGEPPQFTPPKIDYSLHAPGNVETISEPAEVIKIDPPIERPRPISDVFQPPPVPPIIIPRKDIKSYPPPIIFESSPVATEDTPSPSVLVVGGTDGSGTRRVVQILTELGVTMVSEDPETYDIHADLVGGWPEVVRPVLKETKSLLYNPMELSSNVKKTIGSHLQRLLNQVKADSIKPTSHRLAVGGVLPKTKGASASKVAYGFKAPVAMTLSPWWAELLPHFKLLHVVRDGRDIAFSANQ
eukprot:gene1173-1556_t